MGKKIWLLIFSYLMAGILSLPAFADMPGNDSCLGSITEDCHSRFKGPLDKQVDLNVYMAEEFLRKDGFKSPVINNTTNIGEINNKTYIEEQNNATTIGALINAQTGGGGDEITIKAQQDVDGSILGTTVNSCKETEKCNQSTGDAEISQDRGGHDHY